MSKLSFKCFFFKSYFENWTFTVIMIQFSQVISYIEQGQEYAPDLWYAVNAAADAWSQVTKETISNCFRHAGFVDAREPVPTCSTVPVAQDFGNIFDILRGMMEIPDQVTKGCDSCVINFQS